MNLISVLNNFDMLLFSVDMHVLVRPAETRLLQKYKDNNVCMCDYIACQYTRHGPNLSDTHS